MNPRPRDPKSRRLPTGVHPDMVESRGIEPLSEIPTYAMSSYAIDSVSAKPYGELLAMLSYLHSGRTDLAHLHHLVSFHSNKENCSARFIFTSDAATVQAHRFGFKPLN